MLVRHLSYFVTLAEQKHFARAADVCNITQPTLSAAIRKLEEDLAAPLVVRGHRFFGLTAEGERVLAWGRQILTDYDSLRSDLDGRRNGLTGTVRVGVIPSAMPATAVLTARLLKAHPRADVELRSMTSRAIQQALAAFTLDGGLTYLDNEPLDHVASVPLYRERYVFLTSPTHPFATRAAVTWKEAAGERLCLLGEDIQNRRIVDKVAASVGVRIRPTVVSNSFLSVAAHLRWGGWSSIIPHTFLPVLGGGDGVVAVDLVEPTHAQSIGLVLSDRDPRSPTARALVAAVLDADFEAEWAGVPRPA